MADAHCPICNHPAEPDRAKNPAAPFCSQRCKNVDLGRWLGESYSIPTDEQSDEDTVVDLVPPSREG